MVLKQLSENILLKKIRDEQQDDEKLLKTRFKRHVLGRK